MPKHPSPLHRPRTAAAEARGPRTAESLPAQLSKAQARHEPHRLGGDPPRHLALPLLTVAEGDRHLDDAKAGAHGAVGQLDLEGVALRAHPVELDRFEHLAAEALEATREVAYLQPEHEARISRAALADKAAQQAPVAHAAAWD